MKSNSKMRPIKAVPIANGTVLNVCKHKDDTVQKVPAPSFLQPDVLAI